MNEKPFKPFSTEAGSENPIDKETAIILAKLAGGRIDEETLSLIRNRLATRLEDAWTKPGDLYSPRPDILDKLRLGQKIKMDREIQLFIAQLLQDYRLTPDERDLVKGKILEVE